MQRNSLVAIIAVLAAGLLWGTVGPAEILADSPAGPVAVGGARILSGGLVLTAIMLARDPGAFRALPRAAWPALLAAAAATAIFQGTFFTSAARTGAAVATAVTFGIVPVSTGLCERIVLGTRLPRRWVLGTAGAIAGCALISAPHGVGAAGQGSVDVVGIACGVVAGGCFGVYTVSAKHLIGANVNMLAAVPVTLLLGGAALAPWTLPKLSALAGPRSLGMVGWLGPVTVALAYWLYVTGLRRVTAATAATLSLAEPFVAAALGIGLLHERLSLPMAAGALLLLGGLIIVSVRTVPADGAAQPSGRDVGPVGGSSRSVAGLAGTVRPGVPARGREYRHAPGHRKQEHRAKQRGRARPVRGHRVGDLGRGMADGGVGGGDAGGEGQDDGREGAQHGRRGVSQQRRVAQRADGGADQQAHQGDRQAARHDARVLQRRRHLAGEAAVGHLGRGLRGQHVEDRGGDADHRPGAERDDQGGELRPHRA